MVVDAQMRREIHRSLFLGLASRLDATPIPVELPKGIAGVIASRGEDMYFIKLNPLTDCKEEDKKIQHTRLLIHELEHVIQRLRCSLPVTTFESKSAF